mmetsp:Transcript_8474/g.9668  ORF Transcript_8474/g.9668 Transcript_8474/m.9668 type:complete len:218 (+) Transcript_8474:383-1036(+)
MPRLRRKSRKSTFGAAIGRRLSRSFGGDGGFFHEVPSEEERFLEDMYDIVMENAGRPNDRSIFDPPYEILDDFVYMGTSAQAMDVAQLKEMGITRVINFEASNHENDTNAAMYEQQGIKYLEFNCSDTEDYDMVQHFPESYKFIEEAKGEGKVLLYSVKGINLCGFICVAYTLVSKRLDLLLALRHCAEKRGLILLNGAFRKQLYNFARDQDALDVV